MTTPPKTPREHSGSYYPIGSSPPTAYDYVKNYPLGTESWFGCGGAAERLYSPPNLDALKTALRDWPQDKPLTVLGGLANTIIRDSGIDGLVIRPGKGMAAIETLDAMTLHAQAGALNGSVAAAALKSGIGGLEFLSGIPGSLGGAVAMNAGAYSTEMKDVLVSVETVDRQGNPHSFTPAQLTMTYRHTDLQDGMIVTAATLRGEKDSYERVKSRLTEIKQRRNATQPIREKTGGSTFANPAAEDLARAGLPEGFRAWQVVEAIGGRGLKIGGAMMSEQHCNFMINTGIATAADLEALGEELIRRVQDQYGVDLLRWEIRRVGVAS